MGKRLQPRVLRSGSSELLAGARQRRVRRRALWDDPRGFSTIDLGDANRQIVVNVSAFITAPGHHAETSTDVREPGGAAL
jgi:hypothetical protein